MNSVSLNQGSAFTKKQADIFSKKKIIPKHKPTDITSTFFTPWLPDSYQEGATTMAAVSLEGSNEAQRSNQTLTATEVTTTRLSELDTLKAQYATAIKATNDAQNKYNGGITDYISRTNPLMNKNANKNVKLSDGTIGYMTNRGVFEQYDDITKTAGINGCPREGELSDLNFGLLDIDQHPSMISLGPNKPVGTACGNEGTNIYVNSVITDADVKYLGCYTKVYGAMTTITGIDNHDDCKLYAMNNGYKYFGLVNANLENQKVTCVVGNDKAKITSKALGFIYNKKELFKLSGSRTMSALLTNEGQLVLLNQSNGTGKIGARVPTNVAANCQQGGTIRLDNATYGGNCNAYTNKITNRVCARPFKFFGRSYCLGWRNVDSYVPRFPNVPGNNVKGKLDGIITNNTSNQANTPISTIIANSVKNGLAKLTTGINNSIFGDPASGCPKNFVGNYFCGTSSRELNANENGSVTMDCSDVIATCQFYLILQDDGNMCIYRGTGPNDNKGLIWASNTMGQQFKRGNPKTKASQGKYGRNYIRVGEYLNQGEWIGSTNGSMQLMMTSNGSLVLYTIETYDSWVKLKSGKIASVNNDFVAVYELSKVGIRDNLGKMGYIDDNGVLSQYPKNMIGVGKGYTQLKNINVPSNTLGNPITNKTTEECASACESNDKCFGYIYNKGSRTCWLKDNNILKPNRYYVPNADLYLRNTKVIGSTASCNLDVINVESTTWNKYQASGKQMSKDTLCSKFANMEDMPILAYKQDYDDKKNISDALGARINETTNALQSNMASQNAQTTQNTTFDNLSNFIYNTTMDSKIPIAINTSTSDISGFKNIDGYENMYDQNSPSQRARGVQFKNIDAIVEDSTLVAVQENYYYILWSILAVMTSIIVVKILRKQQTM
jgi:hypothetical protein